MSEEAPIQPSSDARATAIAIAYEMVVTAKGSGMKEPEMKDRAKLIGELAGVIYAGVAGVRAKD